MKFQQYQKLRYGEAKQSVNLSLTPTAIALLDELAYSFLLSRSELIEQLARQILPMETVLTHFVPDFASNPETPDRPVVDSDVSYEQAISRRWIPVHDIPITLPINEHAVG